MILLLRPPLTIGKEITGIPLGAMYISSVLKQNGFSTKIIDYTVENNVNIKKIIDKYNPEIVGVSNTWSFQTVNSLKIAKKILNPEKSYTKFPRMKKFKIDD